MNSTANTVEPGKQAIKPALEVIGKRFSPKAFSPEAIDQDTLDSIMTASTYAPSCFNEQPWRYRLFFRSTGEYNKMLALLSASNQEWAKNAPVLVLGYTKKHFDRTGEENHYIMYDLGQSVAHLTLEAMEHGVYTHQMGGFDRKKATQTFSIGEEFTIAVVIAMGKLNTDLIGDIDKNSVAARRKRKSLKDILIKD